MNWYFESRPKIPYLDGFTNKVFGAWATCLADVTACVYVYCSARSMVHFT